MSYALRNKVAGCGGLTMTERYVLETLALYANDDGGSCRPSLDRVAYDVGCDRSTVQRVVDAFKERGVLAVVTAKARCPVDYRINLAVLPVKRPYSPLRRPGKRDQRRASTGGAMRPVAHVGNSVGNSNTGGTTQPVPPKPLAAQRIPLAAQRTNTGGVVHHNPVSDPVTNPDDDRARVREGAARNPDVVHLRERHERAIYNAVGDLRDALPREDPAAIRKLVTEAQALSPNADVNSHVQTWLREKLPTARSPMRSLAGWLAKIPAWTSRKQARTS